MATLQEILARAQALREETALGSIDPERAGSIMYDTLQVINQMQLNGGALVVTKIYASVAAMEADDAPVSDLTGNALKPGQLVVIVTTDTSSSDFGSVYRFDGIEDSASTWSFTGKIGGYPMDETPTEGSTRAVTSGGVYSEVSGLTREATNLAASVNSVGGWGIKLASNDSGNVATPKTPIALSTEGDSLEITFNQIDAQDWAEGGYCFTKLTGSSTSVRGIMVTKSNYRVRSDDATWLFTARSFSAGSTLKIAYESGKMNFYINGTLDTTYNGQKAITIVSFGNGLAGNYNTYWNGIISNVKVNGVTLDVFKDFTYGTAAGPYRANYFLTDSQADGLSYRPPVMASKTATSLNVYRKLFGAYYIKYPLIYRHKAYTADEYPSYYDNWGVNPLYLSRLSDSGMSDVAVLFWAGEAEVAIRVPRADEGTAYVGGAAHGFENIKVENGARDFLLLVDNQAVAETGTFSLKEVKDIQVVQKSELVQAYSNSNPWAEVTKNWHWNEEGFEIHSSVKILRALAIDQAQFGMLSVFRHWLGDTSKNYLTNKAIKNNVPFTTYTVTDGWESVAANSPLWHYDHDCTKITEYGERGLGFALEIPESTLKANGGMKVGTNNTKYNKIYFDLTGAYTPSVDEILSATQKWTIFGEPVIS